MNLRNPSPFPPNIWKYWYWHFFDLLMTNLWWVGCFFLMFIFYLYIHFSISADFLRRGKNYSIVGPPAQWYFLKGNARRIFLWTVNAAKRHQNDFSQLWNWLKLLPSIVFANNSQTLKSEGKQILILNRGEACLENETNSTLMVTAVTLLGTYWIIY